MKVRFYSFLLIVMSLIGATAFAQTDKDKDTEELGLPGDNLDLYAVLDLFQKSKTIEDFEKSLNDEKTKVNNLDLNDDKKVDFIKVETKKDGDNFTFILRDPISKKETQDVAVIMVTKDKNKKVSMQIIGDKDLYGKDYIIEPNTTGQGVTANPGYTGNNPVTVNVPAQTTTVVVEQAPIVQYVYSPAYVPYYPPYYYGYYPPWFGFATVMAVGIYRSNHYYHHHGGYYGHSNVYINHNSYNNYNNNSRNTSNRVSHNNINSGNRNNINNSRNNNNIGNTSRDGNRNSASTRDASNRNSASTRDASRGSSSSRPSTSNNMSSSRSSSGSSLNRASNSGSFRSGGGGGGYRGGGGGFSGGGGRRR
ncbi:hypothetical protein [Flavobacterium aquiphilum]|uniref:hypothetical protein n=1 Tax=Flavobacterium aquiphilum TaxID=3003261 RepID=UPI00247FF47F|nr:hypothetical protein [Flavobacterium aquiphilum]